MTMENLVKGFSNNKSNLIFRNYDCRINLRTLSSNNSSFHFHIKYFKASFHTVIVNNPKSIIWITYFQLKQQLRRIEEHTPQSPEYGT